MRTLLKNITWRSWGLLPVLSGVLFCQTTGHSPQSAAGIGQDISMAAPRIEHPEPFAATAITCMLQDRRGFMWLGSEDGLLRYDGDEVIRFQPDPANPFSLSDNNIRAIVEDPVSGDLWLGTQRGGLNRFDRETERFAHWIHQPDDLNSISFNQIMCLAIDGAGPNRQLWIGTYSGGLNRFDPQSGRFTRWIHDVADNHSLRSNAVFALHISPTDTGGIWAGTSGGGLSRLDRASGEFSHWTHQPGAGGGLSSNLVWAIAEAPQEASPQKTVLWIATSGGLNRLDMATGRVTRWLQTGAGGDAAAPFSIRTICFDPRSAENDRLLLGTFGDGLLAFDSRSGSYHPFGGSPGQPGALSHPSVKAMLADRSGMFWIATEEGVNTWIPRVRSFTHWKRREGEKNSLSSNYIWPICGSESESGATLWIGTINGLNRFNRADRRYTHYFHNPDDPHSLSNNAVLSLLADSSDGKPVLWVGTFNGGLNRLSPRSGKVVRWKHQRSDSASILDNRVYALHRSRYAGEEALWIGSEQGLSRLAFPAGQSARFTHFIHNPDDPHSVSQGYVTHLYESRYHPHFLWIGTYAGGLNRLDRRTGRVSHWQHDGANPASISHNTISGICERSQDEGRFLWLSTEGGGLNRFDLQNEQFITYTTREGLASNNLYALLNDHHGNLWMSSDNGLVNALFDESAGREVHLRRFSEADGLPFTSFNPFSSYRDTDGRLFFGGAQGLVSFHPDSLAADERPSPMAITGLRLFEKPVAIAMQNARGALLTKSITETREIRLSHRDYMFSLRFAVLDFRSPARHRFAYQMAGFLDEWIAAGNKREVTFTNLDPGEYFFRVRGANSRGVWNETAAEIKIIITPPYWQTWWFRLLVLGMLTIALLAIHRYRMSRLREIQLVRARIAADLHDEIASSLASVRLYSEVVQQQIPRAGEESRNLLERIRTLSTEVSDTIREVIWSVDPRHDQLSELLSYIERHARQLFSALNIEFHAHGSDQISDMSLSPEARRAVYLIMKEGMTNIIRHAQCQRVELNAHQDGKWLELVLKDDGAGFDPATQPSGNGRENMKKRAAAIGASLNLVSSPGEGTRLNLRFRMA